jgi:coenzyme F420-reducing hydrogenase gamma subunit
VFRVIVAKLTSCSGCLNELLYALTKSDIRVNYVIEYFTEIVDKDKLTSADIAFIEGSVSTTSQEELLRAVRSSVEFLVAVGTCALYGGVQSLKVHSSVNSSTSLTTPGPRNLEFYDEVKTIDSVVKVDFAIPGCPVSGDAVVSFLRKFALGGLPVAIYESVCSECKRRGLTCVLVTGKEPCLGPITLSGCGAICPAYSRGCYGCYGLKFFDTTREGVRAVRERLKAMGLDERDFKILIQAYSFKLYSKCE